MISAGPSHSKAPGPRRLGMTVLGDFILSEGSAQVVDNLLQAGVTDVATNPTVSAPAPRGTGTLQPPADAGTSPRKFDRPLFGHSALWLQSAPSFHPDRTLYRQQKYGPRRVKELTDASGHVIGEFIRHAVDAGIRVHFQLGAVQPTGLQNDDRPRLPNGELVKNRMADTACLASSAVRDYNHAYVRDLIQHYPEVTGFRIDWPEYPCYTLDEVFQDFHPHVRSFAAQSDLDFVAALHGAQNFREWLLLQLDNRHVDIFLHEPFSMLQLAARFPGVSDWLRLKAALSLDTIASWQQILQDAGRYELTAHAFMPPFSMLTGFHFSRAASHCDAISPKLYTMHWPLMVWFWATALGRTNPHLDQRRLSQAIALMLGLGDRDAVQANAGNYRYPEPHEPHPIPGVVQQQRLQEVRAAIPQDAPTQIIPLVHGYGPPDDFDKRFALAWNGPCDGIWINRYGYLSDEKLSAVRRVVRGTAR